MATSRIKRVRDHLRELAIKMNSVDMHTSEGLLTARVHMARFAALDESVSLIDANVTVWTVVTDSGVPCEWVCKRGSNADRRLLYLHGGGWWGGNIDAWRPLCARICAATGCSVLAADFRRAPEYLFPATVADCLAAYAWMLVNGPHGAGETRHTFIAGDSTGANLALATLISIRQRELMMPVAAVCLSPVTDLTASGDSMQSRAQADPFLSRDTLLTWRELYLSAGDDPHSPFVSPLSADMAGFPPLLIQAGNAEVLLDDAWRFAERADAAGVDVALEIWPEMVHVFQAFAPALAESTEALGKIGAFVRRH